MVGGYSPAISETRDGDLGLARSCFLTPVARNPIAFALVWVYAVPKRTLTEDEK